jgi:hypothetical protein
VNDAGQTFPVLLGQLTLVDLLLLLAPVAVVPLGLRLAPLASPRAARVMRWARLVQPAGAAAAVVAFLVPTGALAAGLALLWLLACAVASLAGLIDIVDRRSIRPQPLLPAAALGFLSVGGAWLVASRAALHPLGFSAPIVELTAVHFHYAGFAATMMAALALHALQHASRARRAAAAFGVLSMLGTPLTAAGIATGSGALTVVGPLTLATGVLGTAALTAFAIAPMVADPLAAWFLRVSAFAVVVPMLLGVEYALGRVFALPTLDLRTMALVHGDLNALLFALLGFIGWTAATRRVP